MLSTKDTLLGACVLLGTLAFGQETAHALTTDKVHDVQTRQAGYKKKDCQILSRQGNMVLKKFLPLKMVCQLLYALAKVGCFNIANETLGDCSGGQLSLSSTVHSGSCLTALAAFSSNIISLLRPLMGLRIR